MPRRRFGLYDEPAPRELITEEIDVTELKKNKALNHRLWQITHQCFSKVQEAGFDLKDYPRGKIFIQRDPSLIPGDPENPANIVAYNFIGFAIVKDKDGQDRLVLKIGPSAVLEAYRGSRFVPYTALLHVLKEYLKSFLTGTSVDTMVVAGNPWFRAICMKLGAVAKTQEGCEQLDAFIEKAARAIYPETVHTEEFAQGAIFKSAWTPLNVTQENSVGTVHLVPVTIQNFLAACYFSLFGKGKVPAAMINCAEQKATKLDQKMAEQILTMRPRM